MRRWVLLLLVGCSGGAVQDGYWRTEIAFQAPAKLGGCAVGDVDARFEGEEICAVSITGDVFVLHREGRKWKSERVYTAPGEMLQCAAVELDESSPGLEILAVGMAKGSEEDGGPGAAFVIRRKRDGKGWVGEKVFEDSALIHGCCASKKGAILVGFSRRARLLQRVAGKFVTSEIATLPGNGKNVVETKDGIVIACSDGSLLRVTASGSEWKSKVLAKTKAGRARLGTDGSRVLSGDDDGGLRLVRASGESTLLRKENSKLRGAVLADLDPTSPGLEAACVGYECALTVLYKDPSGGSWKPRSIVHEALKFHHLSSGRLGSDAATSLVACGYSGRVLVVSHHTSN